MEFQHELVIPDEGLPFKFFLFEGSQGNYVREKHWHTSIEIFAVMEGSLTMTKASQAFPVPAHEYQTSCIFPKEDSLHMLYTVPAFITSCMSPHSHFQIKYGEMEGK